MLLYGLIVFFLFGLCLVYCIYSPEIVRMDTCCFFILMICSESDPCGQLRKIYSEDHYIALVNLIHLRYNVNLCVIVF
jgi:hypothetical protein